MNSFLINFIASFNIILSLIIIIWNLYFYLRVMESERWTKLFYVFIGFLWLLRFIFYFLDLKFFGGAHINSVILIFLTFTLVSLAVGSIVRVRRIFTTDDMIDDIINWMCKNV